MTSLRLKYRTFDGFERALAEQAAHFHTLRPDVAVELSHAPPEELYAEMVAHGGVTSGQYDIVLALTDWLPDLMQRGGLLPLDDLLASDPPQDWPHGWS